MMRSGGRFAALNGRIPKARLRLSRAAHSTT